MLGRHVAHGLPEPDLVVCSPQDGCVAQGQLVLAVAQLGVVGVHRNALGFEGGHHRVGHCGCCRHRDGREADRVVDGHILAGRLFPEEAELPFHGCLDGHAGCGCAGNHALEKGARASLPRLAVQLDHVAHHRGAVGRIGQHHQAVGVRHQANLAHRSHPCHRLELIQHVHGLHGHGQPLARRHPRGRAVPWAPACREWCSRCRSTRNAPGAHLPPGRW